VLEKENTHSAAPASATVRPIRRKSPRIPVRRARYTIPVSAPSPAAEMSSPSVPESPWNASRANHGIIDTYEPTVRLAEVRSSSAQRDGRKPYA
jgi:hypothetical protein